MGEWPDEMRSGGSGGIFALVPKFSRLEVAEGRWGRASRAVGTRETGCAFAGAAALAVRIWGVFGEEGGQTAERGVAARWGGVVRTRAGSRAEVAGCCLGNGWVGVVWNLNGLGHLPVGWWEWEWEVGGGYGLSEGV